MRNLFLLIVKYGGFLSFLGLEFLCFLLIVRFNSDQQKIWIHSSNYFSGKLYDKFDGVTRYWNLSIVADSLASENARLRAELRDARFQEEILGGTVTDEKWQQHYSFNAAEIVNNSISRFNNYTTINRGARHGIEPRQGVIDDKGIIGIVTNVGEYYSSVMSILNKESRIGASLKKNNFFGSLVWQGNDPKVVQLSDVPKHAPVAVGDTIQTSGYSTVFPGGIPIGTVITAEVPQGSNFYKIDVALFNDLSNARYVYVINNLMRIDQQSVEVTNDE